MRKIPSRRTRQILSAAILLFMSAMLLLLGGCSDFILELDGIVITFDSTGGSALEALVYFDTETLIQEPASPTRDGYVFSGWYCDSECMNRWDFSSDLADASMILHAKWVQEYTLIFDSQGGSSVPAQSELVSGDLVREPADPERAGYTFAGWYTEAVCTNAWDFDADTVTGDMTLYADWNSVTCMVSFDSQGGSSVAAQPDLAYGAKVSEPDDPSKSGKAFDGWYTEAVCTNAWDFSSDTVTGDITLYAKWTEVTFSVTFDSQGGSDVLSLTGLAAGSKVTKPEDPTRAGYTFRIWYWCDSTARRYLPWDFDADTISGDLTLLATWNISIYTVTFDSQGGSAVSSQNKTYGMKVSEFTDPTRSGFSFEGWYTEAACTTAWDFAADTVTESLTLYAKWAEETYTVTFNAQGGSAVDAQADLAFGTKVVEPEDPTKSGYLFEYWYWVDPSTHSAVQWDFSSDTLSSDMTLYARWTLPSYTVTFDSSGGSSVTLQSIYKGFKVSEPSDPTKAGFTFDSWYTEAACTNAWDFSSDTVTSDMTLYAKWQKGLLKLLADDGAAYDEFGIAVAVSGDTAVISAHKDTEAGKQSGSAYIFTRSDDGSWSEEAKLVPPDAAADDRFGDCAAIDGDTVAIGSPYDDDFRSCTGSVYIYTRSAGSWSLQQKINAADWAENDFFGDSLDLDGDTLVVGSPSDDDKGSKSGSAYIFTRSDGSWTQQAKLVPEDGAEKDYFGCDVAISGNTLVIGAFGDSDRGLFTGSAYIYTGSGASWSQQTKLVADDGAAGSVFGCSVDIDEDTAVIGSYSDDDAGNNSGSVTVYTRTGTSWSKQAKLVAEDGAASDTAGRSVSISGDTVVMSSDQDDDSGTNSGSAYIFSRTGSTWSQLKKLTPADGAECDYFGNAVHTDGNSVFIGSKADDDKGEYSGSVYVYELD